MVKFDEVTLHDAFSVVKKMIYQLDVLNTVLFVHAWLSLNKYENLFKVLSIYKVLSMLSILSFESQAVDTQ